MMASRGPPPPPTLPPQASMMDPRGPPPPPSFSTPPKRQGPPPPPPPQQQQQPRQAVINTSQSHKSSRLLQSMELFARQKLTIYECYTFHMTEPPPNRNSLAKRSLNWQRAVLAKIQFEQADILNEINELKKTGPSVTTKISDLMNDQRLHVTRLLDDKTRTESDPAFFWILVQLEVKRLQDESLSLLQAESITVYLKREPHHHISAAILYQKIELHKSMAAMNANPYQQNPQYQQKQPMGQGVQNAGGISGSNISNTGPGKPEAAKVVPEPTSKLGPKQDGLGKPEPQKSKEKTPFIEIITDDRRGKSSRFKSPIQRTAKYASRSLDSSDSASDISFTDSDSNSDSNSGSDLSSTPKGRRRQGAHRYRASSRRRDGTRNHVPSKKLDYGVDKNEAYVAGVIAATRASNWSKNPPGQRGYARGVSDADGDYLGRSFNDDRRDRRDMQGWGRLDHRFPDVGSPSRRGMESGYGYGEYSGYGGYRSGRSDLRRDDPLSLEDTRWDDTKTRGEREAELRAMRETEERLRRRNSTFDGPRGRHDLMKDRMGSVDYRTYR